MLPHAAERYRELVDNLSELSVRHIAQAREQIRALDGKIWLTPTAGGYLEAILTGSYGGPEADGREKVKWCGCGERI